VIKGILMDRDANIPISATNLKLFALKGAPNKDGWASIDVLDIQVTPSKSGGFIFDKLVPGKYIMMVKFPKTYTIVKEENGKIIIAILSKGQILDLKTVWVESP
jgi:hypothetical protein